jgi:SAM-dependent methyltransferase
VTDAAEPTATPPSSRVTGRAVPLDYDRTLSFFEQRAAKGEGVAGAPSITITSYQDDDPDLAMRRDQAEWERIEALLALDRRPVALDVGCGVGRWARHLHGRVERYLGIDFAPGLVALAQATLDELGAGEDNRVQVLGAAEVAPDALVDPGPFGLVIVGGVLTYLNDEDVGRALDGIAAVVAADAVVYLREPVGVEERLTLREHWSEELGAAYSAVYRVADDYRSALGPRLLDHGFELVHDAPLDPALANRAQTTQHFFVLRRTA